MKYPKIQTLWKRDMANRDATVMEGFYSRKEFGNIKKWLVTEKIDGTNIRVIWKDEKLRFKGRQNKSKIPSFLLKKLDAMFDKSKFEKFVEKNTLILFGEGYGKKIQGVGDKYSSTVNFILFDAVFNGKWLDRPELEFVASLFDLQLVPVLGIMSEKEIINLIKSKPKSVVSEKELVIEGVVARSYPLLLFNDGTPLMFKLKVKDYEKLGRWKNGR